MGREYSYLSELELPVEFVSAELITTCIFFGTVADESVFLESVTVYHLDNPINNAVATVYFVSNRDSYTTVVSICCMCCDGIRCFKGAVIHFQARKAITKIT